MRYLTALILCALTAAAGATPLDEGMQRLAETVAPQLLDERLRPGVEGPVDLFLLDPADATSGEGCDALSDTLLFRMAAAMQAALREYRRDVATVILRQRAVEDELAMQLEWVARKPGLLELRPSYGRIRGENIAGTFILPVEIATSDLSPAERACFDGAPKSAHNDLSPAQVDDNPIWAIMSKSWQGMLNQFDYYSPYPVLISPNNVSTLAVSYPEFNCGGELRLVEQSGNAAVFQERLTYGQSGCRSGNFVTLTQHSATRVVYEFQRSRRGEPRGRAELAPAE